MNGNDDTSQIKKKFAKIVQVSQKSVDDRPASRSYTVGYANGNLIFEGIETWCYRQSCRVGFADFGKL